MNPSLPLKISSPKITSEIIDDEVIIVNLDNGNYYSMSGLGAKIWGLIKEKSSIKEIFQFVNTAYSGPVETIHDSIEKLLVELKDEGLICNEQNDDLKNLKKINFNSSFNGNKTPFHPPRSK